MDRRRAFSRQASRLLAMALALAAAPAAAQGLVPYQVLNGAIDKPLAAEPGNPGRGRRIVADLDRVSCLICHALPIPEEPDHGAVGPSLIGVGGRMTAGEIRLRLIDPKVVNPASMMPSYYRTDGLNRVQGRYRGQPIYSAQELEDVVAYLAQLKDG